VIQGRAGTQVAALLLGPNPFQSWQIDERYCVGDHIDTMRAARQLSCAKQLIALHEMAQLYGVLP
jgi:hypothetical protein